jgi:hypothetical protein
LGRLLGHIETGLADPVDRAAANPGDLAGLARAFSREHRLDEALECLETAVGRPTRHSPPPAAQATETPGPARTPIASDDGDPWWSVRRRPDFGGRPSRHRPAVLERLDSPWTDERIRVERARMLRRLGRYGDAATAWEGLGSGPGPLAAHAWVEVAKLREHRLADLNGALAASQRAAELANRRRRIGFVDPVFDLALTTRLMRLARRANAAGPSSALPRQQVTP